MKTDKMDQMRTACRTLSKGGKTITNAQIYAAMGAGPNDTKRRDRIRKRITSLRKAGALKWVARGEYEYVETEDRRDAPLLSKAWRAVKAAKPGFSAHDISRRSEADYSHVSRWFRFLESEGFILRQGRKGNTLLYRSTPLAQQTSETPLPPTELRDPFRTEREAVCELTRLFMLADLYQPSTKDKIFKYCRTIMDRFEKNQEEA